MKKVTSVIIIFLAGILCFRFFLVPPSTYITKKEPFMVRVRLLKSSDKVDISSLSGCKVVKKGTDIILGNYGKDLSVRPEERSILINDQKLSVGGVTIIPKKKDTLLVNKTRYRGEINILNTPSGLDVINVVGLENYLKGVVPREMNRFWPMAAMQAQAIASRSFAAGKALGRTKEEYDIRADTFSQVYGGRSSERWRSTKAVVGTKDKVLVYDGEVVPAYFHSCCGGYTRDVSEAWGGRQKPLKKVRCEYCKLSPHFRWRIKIPQKEIQEKLNKKGYSIERIDDIIEGERDTSGRMKYLRIKSGNRWFEIKVDEFRSAVGSRTIKSSNFHIKKYPRFYLFSGYGWGHGVGMCQWGALGMALKRNSKEKILDKYYPGAEIKELSKVVK